MKKLIPPLLSLAAAISIPAGASPASYVPAYVPSAPIAKKAIAICLAESFCGPASPQLAGFAAFRPKTLPKRKLTPVGLELEAALFSNDGTVPPALKWLTIDFDKYGAVYATALPSCRKSLLMTGVRRARRICRESMVGTGVAHVAIESRGWSRVNLPLSLFNGPVRAGMPTVLVHSRLVAPIVVPMRFERAAGRYGLEATLEMPPILGRSAALLHFKFAIKRFFKYEKELRHFALARCFDGHLQARLGLDFADDTSIGGTFVLPCNKKG